MHQISQLWVILLYNFEAAIFRSIGETKMPLEALAVSGVLNVALNLFFVIVLKMTVNGVAIATVIANAVSSVFLFIKFVKTDQAIRIRKEELRFDGNAIVNCFKTDIGILNPVIGALVHNAGSVFVIINSAFLLKWGRTK